MDVNVYMNGKEQLDRVRERVIESIAKNMNLYGVTDSVGRLYGMLYFHDQPMTLDEMKEELGMSKTSMSTSIRHLLELKMVDKVWRKGSRKDLYVAEEDWYKAFTDFFTVKWRAGISMNIHVMSKAKHELENMLSSEKLSEEVKALVITDIEKMKKSLLYYDWLNRLVDSFESGEIFDLIPKNIDDEDH